MLYRLRKICRTAAFPFIGLCICGYMLYHTLQGNYGFLSMQRLKDEVGVARSHLTGLETERQQLEFQVRSLDGKALDLDLLEELARQQGLSDPRDILIGLPPASGGDGPVR